MNYLLAYLKAWWFLFKTASLIYMVCGSILFVFNVHISHLIGIYLLYLVCMGALGGAVKESLDK